MTTGHALTEKLRGWFTGRLPEGLYDGPPEVTVDREEITIVGRIPVPETAEDASGAERAAAVAGRVKEFRERTRQARIDVAAEAEHAFGRKVSWGVRCGDSVQMFTTLSVPVMTRLRQSERQLLDTLVDAGVARSRSDALGWCVRQVGERAETWLADLREAMRTVEQVRDAGPDLG
ncbi:hypothetical protein [Streptacidiphilus sp. PAMC 29251]